MDPVEWNIHVLGFHGYYCVFGDSNCGGVVGLGGRLGLRPSHSDECLEQYYHFSSGNEKSGEFGFSRRGHEQLDDIYDGENSTIDIE